MPHCRHTHTPRRAMYGPAGIRTHACARAHTHTRARTRTHARRLSSRIAGPDSGPKRRRGGRRSAHLTISCVLISFGAAAGNPRPRAVATKAPAAWRGGARCGDTACVARRQAYTRRPKVYTAHAQRARATHQGMPDVARGDQSTRRLHSACARACFGRTAQPWCAPVSLVVT